MRHQQASTDIAASPARVWDFVTDVGRWPEFLIGVETVTPLGHERYRFHVHDGADQHDTTVMVRCQAVTRTISWRSLDGPMFRGRLTLEEGVPGHTRVSLELEAHPRTLAAGLGEMLLPRLDRAARDLHELDLRLHDTDTAPRHRVAAG